MNGRRLLMLLVAAMAAGGRTEADLSGRQRVLLVFAPDAADTQLAEQRRILLGRRRGWRSAIS